MWIGECRLRRARQPGLRGPEPDRRRTQTFTGETIGVAAGECWRLVTSGFLHDPRNPLHLGFNMYVLYWLGTMLEPVLGHARASSGSTSPRCSPGSLGALLLTDPSAATIGASGAVFGLMAAAFVMQRARGINPMQSGIGPVILLNLGITFLIPGISIGGHLGGLAGGALAALAIDNLGAKRRGRAGAGAPRARRSRWPRAVAAIVVADVKAENAGIVALVSSPLRARSRPSPSGRLGQAVRVQDVAEHLEPLDQPRAGAGEVARRRRRRRRGGRPAPSSSSAYS